MKCNSRLFLAIALILFLIPTVGAWYNNSWNYKTDVTVSSTTRPYQLSLNVSNSTGTNNATWVFCNGNCNANFSDLRFTLNDLTPIPYWIENATGINSTTALIWVNLTTTGPIQMYYGNTGASPYSDGNNTFPIFDHFTEASLNSSKWDAGGTGSASLANSNITILDRYYIRSKSQYNSGYSMRARVRMGADNDDHIFIGFMATTSYDPTKMNVLKYDVPDNALYCLGGHDSVGYKEYTFAAYSTTAWQIFEYKRGGTADSCRLTNDSNLNYNGDVFSPNRYSTHDRYLMAQAWTSDMILDWIFMAPYSITGPTWGTWGAEVSGHVTYIPPVPIFSSSWFNTTEQIHHFDWGPGVGNVTDQYQVCVNLVCENTTNTFVLTPYTSHQWVNVTVQAINTSNNTMNTTAISGEEQIGNTAPVLGTIQNKKIYQDKTMNLQLTASDADGDTVPTWYTFDAENYTDWRDVAGWGAVYDDGLVVYLGDYIIYQDSNNNPITFNYNGTDVKFTVVNNTDLGIMNWTIDDGTNTSIDLYNPVYSTMINYTYYLDVEPGPHYLKFYRTGTKNGASSGTQVLLDAVSVNMSGWYGTNATKGTLNNATGLFTWTPSVADVGNYTWEFNYTDGWGGVDSEVINITVKANRLINVDLNNTGWNTILVNDTQNFSSLNTLLSPTYLAIWNGSSQGWEKYKSGWLYRSTQDIFPDNALMILVSTNSTKTLNITHSFNYTLHTGQNFIGFPENITMSTINTSVNVNGSCTNVDEINYNYPSNSTLATYSCVSGASQANASVVVNEGRGAWLNAVQNVTILDALG